VNISLKIPEGTQSGTTFRLKNKGECRCSTVVGKGISRGGPRQTPSKLNKRQRELLQELDV